MNLFIICYRWIAEISLLQILIVSKNNSIFMIFDESNDFFKQNQTLRF